MLSDCLSVCVCLSLCLSPFFVSLSVPSLLLSVPPPSLPQANLCFVDIDNHCIDLPEDFPQFPNKPDFIKELSEVLQSYGLSPQGGAPPVPTTSTTSSPSPGSVSKGLRSLALSELEDDGRNGNLGGEERAVLELLQGNATLERLRALAKRTGVEVGRMDGSAGGAQQQAGGRTAAEELRNAKLNVQLREVFASRFTTMFADYEAFVIQSAPDLESWLTNREQMHNFDKVRHTHTGPLVPVQKDVMASDCGSIHGDATKYDTTFWICFYQTAH